jgi:hypothetical protein
MRSLDLQKKPLPVDLAKLPAQYLEQLENKLQLAVDYSAEHAAREQDRYTHNENLCSRDESFAVGERVIYLMPSSTQKLTRTWIGPCEIVRKNSPYSYIIEFNGKKHWCHASHLRKYNEHVIQAVSNSCGVVFEVDHDFGDIPTLELEEDELNTYRGLKNRHSSSVNDDFAVSDRVIQPSLNKIPEKPNYTESEM